MVVKKGAKRAVLALFILGAAAIITWQNRQNAQLAAAMQQLHAQIDRAQAEHEELETARQQLRDLAGKVLTEQNDTMRLRGENTRLHQQLATAASQVPAKKSPQVPETASKVSEPSQPIVTPFTGTTRVSLNSGQTMVMGGWPTENGKRTLAFATPTVTAEGSVMIKSVYVQVPESVLLAAGWEQFLSVTKESSASGVFTPEQEQQFLETLRDVEGVSVLSSPTILTASGQPAGISMAGDQTGGQTLTISPVVSADNQSVDLTVSHSLQPATTPTMERKP